MLHKLQNYEGSSNITSTNSKYAGLVEHGSFTPETSIADNKDTSITECMENTNLHNEINHCEEKLKHIYKMEI